MSGRSPSRLGLAKGVFVGLAKGVFAGLAKGEFVVLDAFLEPLPDDLLDAFDGTAGR